MIRQLDDRTLVSGQIAPHEVAGLAAQGITVLVNNRPDGEEAGPAARLRHRGGRPAGRDCLPLRADLPRHRPRRRRGDAGGLREAQGGKMLAFCRSGTRSALACALVHREEGATRRGGPATLTEAGFDPGPIAHLFRVGTREQLRRRPGPRRAPSPECRPSPLRNSRRSACRTRPLKTVLSRKIRNSSAWYGLSNRAASTSAVTRAPRRPPQSHRRGGARPSIALRCGKRPNRSMMSWCFLAKSSMFVVAERGEQQHRALLVVQLLAVLERHVEEDTLARPELLVEAALDRRLGDRERELVGRELVGMPRNMLRGNWSNRITPASAVSGSVENCSTGSWRFLPPELGEMLLDPWSSSAPPHHCSASSPNQNLRTSARQPRSSGGASDGQAVDQQRRLADAGGHALAALAANADAFVEREVVADRP